MSPPLNVSSPYSLIGRFVTATYDSGEIRQGKVTGVIITRLGCFLECGQAGGYAITLGKDLRLLEVRAV